MKLFAGLIVQPVVTGVLAFATFPVLLLDGRGRALAGGASADTLDSALAVGAGVAFLACFIGLAALVPAAWLSARRPVSLGESLVWGLGFGNVPVVLGTLFGGSYGIEGFIRGVLFASLLGAGGAAAFWAIALRGRQHMDTDVQ